VMLAEKSIEINNALKGLMKDSAAGADGLPHMTGAGGLAE